MRRIISKVLRYLFGFICLTVRSAAKRIAASVQQAGVRRLLRRRCHEGRNMCFVQCLIRREMAYIAGIPAKSSAAVGRFGDC